jgi:MFS family permease
MGALIVLPLRGSVVEATGCKPLMRVATVMFAIVIAAWILITASVLPCSLALVAVLDVLAGAASASFNLANVRMTMATMPEVGRNRFFALFTVIRSLGLGGATVAWGLFLDALGNYEMVTGAFHWRRHSIYFLALLALNAVAFAYIPRLHESPVVRDGRHLSARSSSGISRILQELR